MSPPEQPATRERSPEEWDLVLRQQAIVARLGQRGLEGGALQDLLDEAAVAVADALRVDNAVFLELLPSWQELAVRAAVHEDRLVPSRFLLDVHVPAGRASQAGYTLMVGEPVRSADLLAEERFQTVAAEFGTGTRSGLTAMIGFEDHPWGVIAVNDNKVRHWNDDDTTFLMSVGNVIGLAIQRQRIEDELRESTTRLDLSLAVGGLGTWYWDVKADRMQLSGGLERLTGNELTYDGTFDAFVQLVDPEDQATLLDAAQGSFANGNDLHVTYRVRRADGERAWIEARGRPLYDATGAPERMVGVATDITERQMVDEIRATLLEREHQARVAAEAAQDRLGFVATASAALARSLDPTDTLETLASLFVPGLCDVCLVDLVDEDGQLHEAAAGARSDQALRDVRELRRIRKELGGTGGLWSEAAVLRSGRSNLVAEITDQDFEAASIDPDHLALFRRFHARSGAVVPLAVGPRVIGVLTLISTEPGRAFDAADLGLVEDLAARAALAVDNARLFESRTRVAQALQANLLPPALPDIPGLQIAARYRAAEAGTEVGGDFYDLFEVGDGSWAIVIGDVCGRGPEAAALTGLMRHSVRAAAVRERRPSRVLGQANDAVIDQIDDTRFATAAFVRLEVPAGPGRPAWVTASSGGHPRPIVVQPDGTVERLDCAGTLLGVLPSPPLVDASRELAPGAALVLYTDGITEARRAGEQFGEDRLTETLVGLAGRPADELAAGIEQAVVDFRSGASDDIALLVLRIDP